MKSIYKEITIVTVTHNSESVIKNFLKNISKEFKLVVIDNNSQDNTRQILNDEKRTHKTLYFNDKGLGFGAGANIGLRKINTKYILLINPDTKITKNNIEKLYAAAIKYDNAAILSPLHVTEKGKKHVPARNFFYNDQKKNILNINNLSGDCSVEHLSGAIMFINKLYLDKIGYFDENFFLYYEDDDLCIRSKKAGYENILLHNIFVGHYGGGSIGPPNFFNQWEKNYHLCYSRCCIEKKYFGYFKSKLLALKIFLIFLTKFCGHVILLQYKKLSKDVASLCGALYFFVKG